MKARIKVKAYTSGNYGVVTNTGRWSLVSDSDIATQGGLMQALKHYESRGLMSLYRALSSSIILN